MSVKIKMPVKPIVPVKTYSYNELVYLPHGTLVEWNDMYLLTSRKGLHIFITDYAIEGVDNSHKHKTFTISDQKITIEVN